MSWAGPREHVFAIRLDGWPIEAAPGQTVAAALWAAGMRSWRTTRSGAPRGLFCGIGTCFDCLVTIDGVPNQLACLVPARPEMLVTTQSGQSEPGQSGADGSRADGTGADHG